MTRGQTELENGFSTTRKESILQTNITPIRETLRENIFTSQSRPQASTARAPTFQSPGSEDIIADELSTLNPTAESKCPTIDSMEEFGNKRISWFQRCAYRQDRRNSPSQRPRQMPVKMIGNLSSRNSPPKLIPFSTEKVKRAKHFTVRSNSSRKLAAILPN